MRSNHSKILFLTTFFFVLSFVVSGQASLPFTYDGGNPGSSITGLSQSGLGTDYASSPKMKFDTSADFIVLNFKGVPGALSFKIKWNQSITATRFPGDFTLQESPDGISYTTVQLYNSTNGTVLANGITITESITSLMSTSRYVKWIYSSRTNGNICIGAINLTAGINPALSVSSTSLSGFTYLIGHGPSLEQSFSVGGTALTNDIIVTPSAGFEISRGSGVNFIAANPVTLVQSGGTVNNTAIYARLKQGLAAGSYNENILINSVGANQVALPCSGTVTPNPTITLTDITDPTLSTVQGISVSQNLNVSGINLSNDMGLAITGVDAGLFTLSQYSGALISGSVPNTIVAITYTPVASGTNTATLTISSAGAMPVTRTLYGNASIATDIMTPENSFTVYVDNGNVLFKAKAGETVEIYNSIGQKLIQKLAVDELNTIAVNAHGVLLVKVGSRVAKVIM